MLKELDHNSLNNSIDKTTHITGNVPLAGSGNINNPNLADIYPALAGKSKKELAKHLFTKMMGVKWCYERWIPNRELIGEIFDTDKDILSLDERKILTKKLFERKPDLNK